MNVQEIINRVAEFSLDETDSENRLQQRILADLNAVYRQAVQAASDSDNDNLEFEDVSLLNGEGTIQAIYVDIASVRDLDNGGNALEKTDILKLESEEPLLDALGTPNKYYTKRQKLYTYPKNDAQVRVRFWPKAVALSLSSTETDILIPVDHHQLLVDGCIHYMKNREQGFHNELDRREAYATWMASESKYLMAVEKRTRATRTTAYYDF